MRVVPLPLRTGPTSGTNAFTADGELQIYEAIKVHKMNPVQVAARVDSSVATIYAIVNRVTKRLATSPQPDQG